jgi:hypothetical protein
MVEMASGEAERESGVEECISSVACDLQRPRTSKVSLMKGRLSCDRADKGSDRDPTVGKIEVS